MSRFVEGRRLAAAGMIAVIAGTAHAQSHRFWAGGPIGSWDDPSSWTTMEGTGPMGGVPQTGNAIFLREAAVIIYDGAGIADPTFARIEVECLASGQGSTQLLITASTLHADNLAVGEYPSNNASEIDVSGGMLSATNAFIVGGEFVDNILRVSGAGVLDVQSNIFVGHSGQRSGDALLIIDGGSATANDVVISTVDYIASAPPFIPEFVPVIGVVEINGGSLTADHMIVGESEVGRVFQTAGDIDLIDYTIGNVDNHFPSASAGTHLGGTLDVTGTITVGAAPEGEGILSIDGAAVTAENIRTGEGPNSDGTIALRSGSLDVTTMRLAINTPADIVDFVQSGGALTAETVTLGEFDTFFNASWDFTGGTATITDSLTIGLTTDGMGGLSMTGGTMDANRIVLGGGALSAGTFFCTGGVVGVQDRLSVGPLGRGYLYVAGGGEFVASETFIGAADPNSRIRVEGGVFASAFLTNASLLECLGGLTTVGSLIGGEITNESTGTLIIENDAELRTGGIVNQGEIVFGAGGHFVSGPLFGFPVPTPLVRTIDNDGLITVESTADSETRMNIVNSGAIDLAAGSTLNLTGDLTCEAGGQINVAIDASGPGTIELLNSDGVLAGSLEVAFDPALGVPPMGTEYDIVRLTASAGSPTLTGTFSGVSMSGPAAELVYEPNRVYLRIVQCGSADLTGDGLLNNTDINVFVSAFLGQSPIADLDNNELWNNTDINAFVSAFVLGCN